MMMNSFDDADSDDDRNWRIPSAAPTSVCRCGRFLLEATTRRADDGVVVVAHDAEPMARIRPNDRLVVVVVVVERFGANEQN